MFQLITDIEKNKTKQKTTKTPNHNNKKHTQEFYSEFHINIMSFSLF